VLAGGIAHDFNNLLTGIVGNAALARQELGDEHAEAQQVLGQVELSAQRAAELCKQLLTYAGKGRFVVQPLDLNAVVQQSRSLLQLSISKMVDLRLDLAPELSVFRGDETQVRQVLMNLVINASEAIGQESGVVTVRTREISSTNGDLRGLVGSQQLPHGRYLV